MTLFRHIVFTLTALFSLDSFVFSQTVSLSGRVVTCQQHFNSSAKNEAGIPGRQIILKSEKGDTLKIVYTRSPDGYFKFDSLSSGNYKISYYNYYNQYFTVDIFPNKHLKLCWDAFVTPTDSAFIQKISNGDTIFYNGKQTCVGGFKHGGDFYVFKVKNKIHIYCQTFNYTQKPVARILADIEIKMLTDYELKIRGTKYFDDGGSCNSFFTIKYKDKEIKEERHSHWTDNYFVTLCYDLNINWY